MSDPAALFVNTQSRRGARHYERALALLRSAGVAIGLPVAVADPRDLPRRVEAAITLGYDRIIIGGGDGTLSSTIAPFVNQPITLGVLPLGTGNDLARSLGVHQLERAVGAIAEGRISTIDLAEANGRYFVNTLKLGLADALARGTNREMKQMLGNLSYVVVGIPALLRQPAFRVRLRADDREIATQAHLLVVANGRYIGINIPASPDASVDNRQLAIFALGGESLAGFLWQGAEVILGRHVQDARVHYFTTEALTIAADPPQRVMLDGESAGVTPVTVRLVPNCLRVFAPRDFRDEVGLARHVVRSGAR